MLMKLLKDMEMGTHELITKFDSQKYIKLIVSIAGTMLSALMALGVSGGHLSPVDLVNIAIAGVAAFQVWYVTETSDNPNGKAVISGVAAALVALSSILGTGGGIHAAEIAQILVAALTATGLLATKSTALTRKALPASYANNTYVVNAGTPAATTVPAPQTVIVDADATQLIPTVAVQEEPGK